jgi:PAS domain S-box-containing protein
MPQIFLYVPTGRFREELLRAINDAAAPVVVIEGSDVVPGDEQSRGEARFAIVPWQPAAGLQISNDTVRDLRDAGVRLIAVVEDQHEEEACLRLGHSVCDIVTASRPARLLRHLGVQQGDASGMAPTAEHTSNSTMHAAGQGSENEALLLFDESRSLLQWNSAAELLFNPGIAIDTAAAVQSRASAVAAELLDSALTAGEASTGHWSGVLTLSRDDGTLLPLRAQVHVLRPGVTATKQYLLLCRPLPDTDHATRRESPSAPPIDQLKGITYQRRVADPQSLILLGAVRELTGYDVQEFTDGKVHWPDLLHPEDKPRMLQILDELISGSRSSFDETYRIRDRAGNERRIKDVAGRWVGKHDEDVIVSGLILEIHHERDFTDRMLLSEMLYRNLWEMETDALFLIERDTGRILEVNGTACRLYGFEREELLSRRNVDLSAEPERTHTATHSDVTQIPVRWHRKKNGTVFPVEIHATHFVWNGRSVHLAAIRDISERLRHEALLLDAETRYRAFFEQSPDGIVVLDPISLTPREFNNVAHTQLGFSQEDFVLRSFRDLFVETDVPLDDVLSELRHSGRADFNCMMRRHNGSLADMDMTFVAVDLAERTIFYCIMRDVSARRLVEANLRTLSRAVEQSPVMIVITDADGIIEYVNPRFSAVTGYAAAEVIGQTPRLLKSGETSDTVYSELWRTLAGGEEWRGELRNRRKNGELYWALVSISPVRDANGRTMHYVAVQDDITASKLIQQDLIEARDRAERSDRLKDAFIANMSHEIRTPLNIILGFTGVLKSLLEKNTDEEIELCLDSIERGGARLLRTVEEILNISSIQAGTFPHAPLPLPVDHHVQQTIKDFSAQAAERRLSLDFHPGSASSYIIADPYVFVQALSNLLDNALKFTKEGGVRVTTTSGPEHVVVEVEDSGIGIAAEYLPFLFDSFTQEHSGNSRPFEGLGLGMALTRRYVEMCDGDISVHSEKGKGTKFTLTFPASQLDPR